MPNKQMLFIDDTVYFYELEDHENVEEIMKFIANHNGTLHDKSGTLLGFKYKWKHLTFEKDENLGLFKLFFQND